MRLIPQRDATPKRLVHILEVLQGTDYELGTAGWIKGRLNSPDGYCVIGAIEVQTPFPGSSNAKWWAKRYIEDAAKITSIAEWNDDPKRTYKQVDAAIQKAIKQVKKELARG